MKKFLTFISTFVFFFKFTLVAQEFKAGLLGGITTTQVSGDGLAGFDKAGITLGGYVERNMSKAFSLAFEINYIQKGSRSSVDPNSNYFYRMRLSYIEIPLTIHLHFKNKISFGTGPSVATLISSSEADVFGVYPNTLPFKKIDISGLADAGFLLSSKTSVHIRYSQSLLPIRSLDDVAYTNAVIQGGQYNSVLSLFLQLHF